MQRIRWFLIISGVLVLMVFSLSNTKSVSVQMPLLFHAEIPLSMVLAIAGLIGFSLGMIRFIRLATSVSAAQRDADGIAAAVPEKTIDNEEDSKTPERRSTTEN